MKLLSQSLTIRESVGNLLDFILAGSMCLLSNDDLVFFVHLFFLLPFDTARLAAVPHSSLCAKLS